MPEVQGHEGDTVARILDDPDVEEELNIGSLRRKPECVVLVRKWPLRMDAQHLFDELLLVAARLGVEIRIERFETPATMGGRAL